MTLPATKRRYTIQEYLRMERDSLDKHEYDNGEILAMAGASRRHMLIMSNVGGELHTRLKGKPCQPYVSDLRVYIHAHSKYVYPDVSVICGDATMDENDDQDGTFVNPRLIVEVLSPSTERYDRGEKFDAYRTISSLREYILVAQDHPRVESYFRSHDGTWSFHVAIGIEASIRLRSLEVELSLGEIYAGVTFPNPPRELTEQQQRQAQRPADAPAGG